MVGPAPAPLARLRGRHRVQLLVKGGERAAVHATFGTPDQVEGMRAFLGKRKPVFNRG